MLGKIAMAGITHHSELMRVESAYSLTDMNRSSNDQTRTALTAWAQARRRITTKSYSKSKLTSSLTSLKRNKRGFVCSQVSNCARSIQPVQKTSQTCGLLIAYWPHSITNLPSDVTFHNQIWMRFQTYEEFLDGNVSICRPIIRVRSKQMFHRLSEATDVSRGLN